VRPRRGAWEGSRQAKAVAAACFAVLAFAFAQPQQAAAYPCGDGVASATPTPQLSKDKSSGTVEVILEGDPFTQAAFDVVPEIRASVADLGPGLTALVGGGSAIQYDFDEAIESDLKLIAPIALLAIAIILAILLRSLVAPLVLIASVILSFLCTLGLSVLFIRYVVDDPGIDASIPTFAFIFLVALGIDYTIFLMARVREEARRHGTREGMLRALAATGYSGYLAHEFVPKGEAVTAMRTAFEACGRYMKAEG